MLLLKISWSTPHFIARVMNAFTADYPWARAARSFFAVSFKVERWSLGSCKTQ